MGCGGGKSTKENGNASNPGGGGASGGGDKAPAGTPSSQQLLQQYTLGEVLGQGAFGVVYACTKKGQKDFKYAVKMVDKVETPVAEIKKEADMLKELECDWVVKFHDLYYEKCFVCIVMDRYNGGDLIEGMQLHWKTRGKIPCTKVVHVVRQMALAIEFCHSKLIVHRDVKGDNYLTDRKDITDPKCRVYMSDVGTALKLTSATQRLKDSCGTKIYWPPEFYDKNYGLKVDVWALGVIMYGLLDGRFPFKTEEDVRKKQIRLPANTPSLCQEFTRNMLQKSEEERKTAKEIAEHGWIKLDAKHEEEKGEKSEDTSNFQAEGLREGGANAAQDERRKELLERLENKGQKPVAATQLNVLWNERFDVNDRRTGTALRYEWWEKSTLKSKGVVDLDTAISASNDTGKVEEATVAKMLREHNIDHEKLGWGKGEAKSLTEFSKELNNGSASLMLDAAHHKKLVRVVNVVLLRISHGDGPTKRFLTEDAEKFADGRERKHLNRIPGTKKEPHENTKATTARIMKDMIGLGTEKKDLVSFNYDDRDIFEEEEESRSYPGVITVYRKEIVDGKVVSNNEADLKSLSLGKSGPSSDTFTHTDTSRNTKQFKWYTEDECNRNKINIKGHSDNNDVSGLVQAPIGFGEEELKTFLTTNNVAISRFGEKGAKTLKEFSDELLKGDSSLMVDNRGRVLRIVDVALLYIMKEDTNKVLVLVAERNPENQSTTLNRLPGAKRRPDENQFVTAQRVLKRQLKMDENFVSLKRDNVKVIEQEEESNKVPGLTTLYRKRIIEATLHKPP